MSKITEYDPNNNKVSFQEVAGTWWENTKMATAQAIVNFERSSLRRKAVNAQADHLLRDVYLEQEIAEAKKEAAKAQSKVSKLEAVVAEVSN